MVSDPAVPVLLLAIVPPDPLNPPTATLNVLRSSVPPFTVRSPVPVGPLVMLSVAPLPLVVDATAARMPVLIVVPPV